MKIKKWKLPSFSLFIVFCILLNYGGRSLSVRFQLPLWLDSFGTALSAYLTGPVCGSIVGLTGNLINGMENRLSVIYALVSVSLGIIVGLAAKRNKMDTMFGTMAVSSRSAVAAVALSTPLNILFYNGSTGNVWGDGVIAFLREHGFPWLVSEIVGQFYIDFLDKLFTLIVLFLLLKLIKTIAKKRGGDEEKQDAETAAKALTVLLAVSLCLYAAPVRAQETAAESDRYNDYVQTVYSRKNGLPCGEANDIAQTNDGILWIGTYAGLYRYNGREFRWMDGFESVRNVNCLYVDEEGRLWIGTNDNGLSIAINEEIVNVIDQSMGLPSNSVRSVIQGADGYYYVGTTDSMQILSLNGGLKRLNALWEVNYADHLAADGRGHVAAITSNGRLFLLRGGNILSARRMASGGEIFKTCCFAPDGRLLAGTTTGRIVVFDISGGWFDEKETIVCGGLTSLKTLYYLDSGDLFITADNGVGYLDAQEAFHAVNTNDFDSSIDNMLMDYQGNMWFTSSRLGLLRLAPSAFRDVYSTVGMSSRVVNTVIRWQDAYYFGTDKGLDAVDLACKTQITNALTEAMKGTRIRCMTVDRADHLWICTYGSGLVEVEPGGQTYRYDSEHGGFGSRARLVTELRDGTILAGGDTGVGFIRDHQVVRSIGRADGLINSMILTAVEQADGRILVGTDGDGIAVIEDGQVTRMLTRDNGLSSEVILRMVADPQGAGVLIVTSNGLCYMDGNGAVSTLNAFPYYNNYDIWVKDEHTLFVLSSAGIFVVDRDELLSGKEEIKYELLDNRVGLNGSLTANAWNYSDEAGNLFLPCDIGVFIIDTQRYAASSRSYRMMVTSVRQDNQAFSVERDMPIIVDRGVSKIEMFPEIINYSIQDPNVGYYLEGFDNHWTILPQSSLNTIVYTNLPTGRYNFRLAVFDSNRQEILSERSYELIKEKAFYDEPGFIVYILLVPVLAVAWFTWFFVRTRVQRMLDIQKRELALARQQVQMGEETIVAIAKAVDAKDVRTSQHSQRVAQYSVMIAKELGFSEKECEDLRKTALMHDIGKIGIPDAILNKPARLTDEEYVEMKTHTTRGAEILKELTLIDHVVDGALHHHERFDGRGYPNGMKGEEIPINARIIGVADAFDAMTANRVYRKQMDFDYVLGEMRKGRGTQFDPQMADILLRLIDEGKINLKELYAPKDDAQSGGKPGGQA